MNNNNNNPTSKSDRLLNDEMMAINFTSDDQVIHFCLPCKKSDKFSILEKSYLRNIHNIKIRKDILLQMVILSIKKKLWRKIR